MKTKITNLPESVIRIEDEISSENFMSYEEKALLNLGKEKEFPGFRKGNAPAEIIKKNIPEIFILEEMAGLAISDKFRKIIEENKLEVIGRPNISITKLAKNNPLEFNILIAIIPEIKKQDYKKITQDVLKEKEITPSVEDSEIEETIKTIQKMRIHEQLHSKKDSSSHDHNHPELEDKNLPPPDDTFAQSLGNFKNLEELRAKLKENILEEKKMEQKSKRRAQIAEALVKNTDAEIPKILIDAEAEQLLLLTKQDIKNAGLEFEKYLKQINKSEEDMRLELKKDAEKKVKLALIVRSVAKENDLFPSKEEIKKEAQLIMKNYKDADPDRVENYIEDMLTKESVMKFLEN